MIVRFFRVGSLPETGEANSIYFVVGDGDYVEAYATIGNGAMQRFGTTEIVSPDIAWTEVLNKPTVFPPSAHNHDDRYFTKNESNEALINKADLIDGKLVTSQFPPLAIVEFLGTVASQAAMLALVGQRGDWCIRSDQSKVFILTADIPSVLASWQAVEYPTYSAAVSSVNGQTGTVVLGKANVGLVNVPNVDATQRANHSGTQDASTITGNKTWNFISDFAIGVRGIFLTGLSIVAGSAITSGDTVLSAFGKLQGQINDLLAGKADKAIVTRSFSGTTDTLLAADIGKEIRATSASAKAISVPGTATLGMNFICAVYNYGAGGATFAPMSGVTIRNNVGGLAQYKTATLRAVGANEYQLTGEMA